jgi:hypothetical protein
MLMFNTTHGLAQNRRSEKSRKPNPNPKAIVNINQGVQNVRGLRTRNVEILLPLLTAQTRSLILNVIVDDDDDDNDDDMA